MPLATLLIAGDRALPPLMGTDPIESQLRRARGAGAAHAVIFATRVTSDLLAVVDRLRRDGLTVDLARSVGDAAEYIHPDEDVLVVVPELIIADARLEMVAESTTLMLLCVANHPANGRFELIDQNARWTGVARIDGGLLRRTAATLGDWDFASTLMRRAVQDGARLMTLTADDQARDVIYVGDAAAARLAGQALLGTVEAEKTGFGATWIAAPVARIMARVAAETNVGAQWLTLAGLVMFTFAAGAAFAGWLILALILTILAYILDIAGYISRNAAMATSQFERFRFPVRAGAACIVVIAIGVTLALRTVQWGCITLSLVILGASWLVGPLMHRETRWRNWHIDPVGYALIGLIGFAAGSPIWALALSATLAAATLVWVVRKLPQG